MISEGGVNLNQMLHPSLSYPLQRCQDRGAKVEAYPAHPWSGSNDFKLLIRLGDHFRLTKVVCMNDTTSEQSVLAHLQLADRA